MKADDVESVRISIRLDFADENHHVCHRQTERHCGLTLPSMIGAVNLDSMREQKQRGSILPRQLKPKEDECLKNAMNKMR